MRLLGVPGDKAGCQRDCHLSNVIESLTAGPIHRTNHTFIRVRALMRCRVQTVVGYLNYSHRAKTLRCLIAYAGNKNGSANYTVRGAMPPDESAGPVVGNAHQVWYFHSNPAIVGLTGRQRVYQRCSRRLAQLLHRGRWHTGDTRAAAVAGDSQQHLLAAVKHAVPGRPRPP